MQKLLRAFFSCIYIIHNIFILYVYISWVDVHWKITGHRFFAQRVSDENLYRVFSRFRPAPHSYTPEPPTRSAYFPGDRYSVLILIPIPASETGRTIHRVNYFSSLGQVKLKSYTTPLPLPFTALQGNGANVYTVTADPYDQSAVAFTLSINLHR